jgi:hypothetical protein
MCGTLPYTDSTQEHVLALLCIMESQSRLKVLLQSMVEYLVLSFMTTDIFEQKLRHKVVSSDIFSWHRRVRFDAVRDEVLHSATLVVVRRHVRVGLAGAVLHRKPAELYTIGGLSYRENSSL